MSRKSKRSEDHESEDSIELPPIITLPVLQEQLLDIARLVGKLAGTSARIAETLTGCNFSHEIEVGTVDSSRPLEALYRHASYVEDQLKNVGRQLDGVVELLPPEDDEVVDAESEDEYAEDEPEPALSALRRAARRSPARQRRAA